MEFSVAAAQQAFVDRAASYGRERVGPGAADIDRTAAYPRALVTEAAALGLVGVTLPAEWGGAGQDYVTYALAIEAVAMSSATVAVILAVSNSLVVEPIAAAGTAGQKTKWLRALTSGAAIGAFALSEEQAGSDAANQQASARPDGTGYVLSGRKVWVANGAEADVAVVFARVADAPRQRAITAFLVPLDRPGVARVPVDSLGVRGLGCVDLDLSEVRLGADERLGDVGDGWRIALAALAGGRVAIAAQALGVGQAALDEALAYARARHAFGQRIGDFQAIQFQLADLAVDLEAARMLMWKAAGLRARGEVAAMEAAMAKLQASEAAHRSADRAMQILASAGYRRGSHIERLFRDVRAAEIYQGTSEVQRMVIARHIVGEAIG
jgi:alkylation response protein AidB-like acyl-CoA dehydrogenase